MIASCRLHGAWVTVACTTAVLWAQPVLGCAVCFGDPESPMARGVSAGVVVLIGVVGFVLMGIAGTGLFWIHRSRRLAEPALSEWARTE